MNSHYNYRILTRRVGNQSKDNFWHSLEYSETEELANEIILKLRPGTYNLNTLLDAIIDKVGCYAALRACEEKRIRGLEAVYPAKVKICFTHGLGEFYITNKRKYV